MADLYPVAGSKIYIGGVLPTQSEDFVEEDFAGQAFEEIDGWETMGVIGDAAQIITTQLINRGRDVKQKGTRNAGSMQNNFAVISDDAGQLALIAAEKTPSNYAFKIEFNDAPGGPGAGTVGYFVGLVTSAQRAGGGANTVMMINSTVEINSNIVLV